jgi:hypothetical protein
VFCQRIAGGCGAGPIDRLLALLRRAQRGATRDGFGRAETETQLGGNQDAASPAARPVRGGQFALTEPPAHMGTWRSHFAS